MDTAIYCLEFLYSSVTNMLTDTRREARLSVLNKLFYLFMDWTQFPNCEVSDSAVTMRWVVPFGQSVLNTRPKEELPVMSVYADDAREERKALGEGSCAGSVWEGSNASNIALYTDICRSVDDVTRLVKHDCLLRNDKRHTSIRRHVGGDLRSWCRAVNLVDVVHDYLQALCGFFPRYPAFEFLNFNHYSVELLYTLALTLRRILSSHPGRYIYDPEEAEGVGDDTEHPVRGDHSKDAVDPVSLPDQTGDNSASAVN